MDITLKAKVECVIIPTKERRIIKDILEIQEIPKTIMDKYDIYNIEDWIIPIDLYIKMLEECSKNFGTEYVMYKVNELNKFIEEHKGWDIEIMLEP